MRVCRTCQALTHVPAALEGTPAVTTFAEFFGLADPRRTTLELSPEHDAALFIDQDGVVKRLEEFMRPEGNPFQAVIYGDFGTGKTHALRHVEKVLAPAQGFWPVYIELSGFGSRSSFLDLHIRVMKVLVDKVEELLRAASDLPTWLESQQALSGDMREALKQLAAAPADPTARARLKAWLMGTGPTPSQAHSLGLSGTLFAHAGPVELASLWKTIGSLVRTVQQRTLLLLVDEAESFQKVTSPDAQADLGSGLRHLFDADNRSLGFVLALNTPQSREGLHPMLRYDVKSRLKGKELELKSLGEPERIRRFVSSFWQKLRPAGSNTPLLEPEALEQLINKLPDYRDAITFGPRSAYPIPTQRELVRVLAFLGMCAYNERVEPPMSAKYLNRCFAI